MIITVECLKLENLFGGFCQIGQKSGINSYASGISLIALEQIVPADAYELKAKIESV